MKFHSKRQSMRQSKRRHKHKSKKLSKRIKQHRVNEHSKRQRRVRYYIQQGGNELSPELQTSLNTSRTAGSLTLENGMYFIRQNMNNTCFLDSVLQILLHLPLFVEALRMATPKPTNNTTHFNHDRCITVVNSLKELVQHMEPSSQTYSPSYQQLITNVRRLFFKREGNVQEDASEFLVPLLDCCQQFYGIDVFQYADSSFMHRLLTTEPEPPLEPSAVLDMTTTAVVGDKMSVLTITEEPSPPLTTTPVQTKNNLLTIPLPPASMDLNTHLTNLLHNEETMDDYKWEDDGTLGGIKIVDILMESGPYLAIQLNRFEMDSTGQTQKIDTPIHINEELHIRENSYRVCGAIFHQGPTAQGGHYTSWFKFQNNWFSANDMSDRPNQLIPYNPMNNAYLVFYEKITK